MSRYSPLCTPSTSGRAAATGGTLWLSGPTTARAAVVRKQHLARPNRGGMQAAQRTCRAASSDSFQPLERRPDEEYMKEYNDLKNGLLDNTRKCCGAVAAYLLFTVGGEASVCALVGGVFGYAYLNLLYRDVDAYTGDTVVPMMVADEIDNAMLRKTAKVAAAYQQALRPRLLVPIGLAASTWVLNAAFGPEGGLPNLLLYQGCLLGGFLSYKLALLIKLVDELTPKSYNEEAMWRPRVEQMDDELDLYGRPKKSIVRMPTEALPEGAEPEKSPLAGLILAADEALTDDEGSSGNSGNSGKGAAGIGAGAGAKQRR